MAAFAEALPQTTGPLLTSRNEEKPAEAALAAPPLEIMSLDNSGTYRAVYTVGFEDAVYVLHAYQKESKKGVETPKSEIGVVRRRLTEVERLRREKNK